MWITKDGVAQLIEASTLPYWRSLGWQVDANQDQVGDETAAALVAPSSATPNPIGNSAAAGTATATARADHVHTGQQLAAIAAPSGGLTIDAQARTAIDAIRAALTAHGITL
jgi:glutamate 5-kinase